MAGPVHIVLTDSGLGGLTVCAALEQRLRVARLGRRARLTYVNAWPSEDRGYNDLPDAAARARVFDAALSRIAAMHPDLIVIACNTLSVLYPQTEFSRQPASPVQGILDAGADLFAECLRDDAAASMVLIGTKTTIESGAHRDRLAGLGIDPSRVGAVSCHGLAAAIERDVDGLRTAGLIELCASKAAEAVPPGGRLLLGLCCTHYGYVASRLVDLLARKTGRPVRAVDPGARLVDMVVADNAQLDPAAPGVSSGKAGDVRLEPIGSVPVELISKVTLTGAARSAIARLVEPVSGATARALLSYVRVPDLF